MGERLEWLALFSYGLIVVTSGGVARLLTENKPTVLRVAAIFTVALALRLVVLATTDPTAINTRWCPVCGDSGVYNTLALNLLTTHSYQLNGQPMAERPPLYSGFVALIYAVTGVENFAAVRLVQVLLSAATVVILSEIAQRVFGTTAAWITGGLMAIYPFPLIFSVELYGETLFTFLIALLMWLLFPYSKEPHSIRFGLVAGVLIGLSALTRELAIMLLPAITAWQWLANKRLWANWLVALWLGTLAVIGVWAGRNYLIWQQFIPLTTHTFTNIVHSIVDDYGHLLVGASATIPADVPPDTINPYEWLGGHNQVEQEQYSRQLVLSYCSLRPEICLQTWAQNFGKLINPIVSSRAWWVVLLTAPLHIAVWGLGITGWVLLVRQKKYDVPIFLAVWFGLCLGVSSIAHVEIRYRMPVVDPYLAILGSYPLSLLWYLVKGRWAKWQGLRFQQ